MKDADVVPCWGQPIIGSFFMNGGFRSKAAMKIAYRALSKLSHDTLNDDIQGRWEHRRDAIVLWILIAIELQVDVDALLEIANVVHVLDPGARPEHPLWFAQLAFDLFSYKWTKSSDTDALIALRLDLEKTLQNACRTALTRRRLNRLFIEPWFSLETLTEIFGTVCANSLSATDPNELFPGTRRLLADAAHAGCDEAYLVNVIVGFGTPQSLTQDLTLAAESVWPTTQQLAKIFTGLRYSDRHLKTETLDAICFPNAIDEDDSPVELGEYVFRGCIAIRARLAANEIRPRIPDYRRDQFWHGLDCLISVPQWTKTPSVSWPRELELVRNQWDIAEISAVRLQEDIDRASSGAVPEEHVRGAALEVARLIEIYFKSCLLMWPLDEQVHGSDRFFSEERSWGELNNYIGQSLGDGPRRLKLDEVMQSLGIWPRHEASKPSRDFFNVFRTFARRRPGAHVLKTRLDFPALVASNALCAATNANHIFRQLPIATLERSICMFKAAYDLRSKEDIAHWMPETASPEETIFWSILVRHHIALLLGHMPQSR